MGETMHSSYDPSSRVWFLRAAMSGALMSIVFLVFAYFGMMPWYIAVPVTGINYILFGGFLLMYWTWPERRSKDVIKQ